MGQLQQAGGAGETLEGEIRPQAVADDRDVQLYRDHEQLLGLLGREELALVAEDTGQRGCGSGLLHRCKHVHFRRDQQVGLAAHAQAADQLAAALGIHLRLEDEHPHSLLLVVVGHLHQGGALAAVHGTVTKIKFCHCFLLIKRQPSQSK